MASIGSSSSVSSCTKNTSLASPPAEAQMSALDVDANDAIKSIWQDAHCLTWDDSFEEQILHATNVLHNELRPFLQLGATIEACEKIEQCSEYTLGILAAWTIRNQLISRRIQSIVVESPGSEVEKLAFRYQLQCLPTAAGCEVNFETAQKIEKYFTDKIVPLFTASVLKNDSSFDLSAAQRIRATLATFRKRCAAVCSSAKTARDDAARVRPLLPDFLVTMTADRDQKAEEVRVHEGYERRISTRVGRQVRDLVKKPMIGVIKVKADKWEKEKRRLGLLRELVCALEDAGTEPVLDALPPTSLPELMQQKQRVRAQIDLNQHKEQERAADFRADPVRKDSVVETPAKNESSRGEEAPAVDT
ncbi:hypothetical protein IWZ03DRAFT_356991 [Phyllosticta citriasiana]|uniref:Uncharacterized protein n=1 Tax=Phyllosticta citriasiana TaxID=595635 RepID=A0ABR1L579_9PEZI